MSSFSWLRVYRVKGVGFLIRKIQEACGRKLVDWGLVGIMEGKHETMT